MRHLCMPVIDVNDASTLKARRKRFRHARSRPDFLGPRSARWSRRSNLRRLAAVVIALAAVVGGRMVVARGFDSPPSVAPPVPDSENQSRLQFTVSNTGRRSLYGVHLRCGVADITMGDGANIPVLGIAGSSETTVGDIPPHNQGEFACPINVQSVRRAQLWVEVSWKLHLLGVIPWKQQQGYVFELIGVRMGDCPGKRATS